MLRSGQQRGFNIVLCQQYHIGGKRANPLGTHTHLAGAFFAGNVKNRPIALGHALGHLQKDGRFANARLPTQQQRTARHNAAAQNAVQFLNIQRETLRLAFRSLGQGDRLCKDLG